ALGNGGHELVPVSRMVSVENPPPREGRRLQPSGVGLPIRDNPPLHPWRCEKIRPAGAGLQPARNSLRVIGGGAPSRRAFRKSRIFSQLPSTGGEFHRSWRAQRHEMALWKSPRGPPHAKRGHVHRNSLNISSLQLLTLMTTRPWALPLLTKSMA